MVRYHGFVRIESQQYWVPFSYSFLLVFFTGLVNYAPPKGGELQVFASTEPLVLPQHNRKA